MNSTNGHRVRVLSLVSDHGTGCTRVRVKQDHCRLVLRTVNGVPGVVRLELTHPTGMAEGDDHQRQEPHLISEKLVDFDGRGE